MRCLHLRRVLDVYPHAATAAKRKKPEAFRACPAKSHASRYNAKKSLSEQEVHGGNHMTKKEVKTIGVLTSGGDAPGMNAAIRAVVRTRSEERRVGKECGS